MSIYYETQDKKNNIWIQNMYSNICKNVKGKNHDEYNFP